MLSKTQQRIPRSAQDGDSTVRVWKPFLTAHCIKDSNKVKISHLEGLREEPLDFTRARHSQFVILRQVVHSQDSNDVLKGLVVLKWKM